MEHDMAQADERFPYFDFVNGPVSRFFATAMMLLFGLLFLSFGNNANQVFGPGSPTIEANHTIFSQIVGFALIIFGCIGVFWTWRGVTHSTAVVVSMETVSAPNQGVFGNIVEIPFIEITHLQKLSIDGHWEFKIGSRDKHIRITKASFKVAGDFDKAIQAIHRHAPKCDLEIKERIDPPTVGGGGGGL